MCIHRASAERLGWSRWVVCFASRLVSLVLLDLAALVRFGRSCSSRSSCMSRPVGARLGCFFCFASVPRVPSSYLLLCMVSPLLMSRPSSVRPVSPTLDISSDASCNFIFISIMLLRANFAKAFSPHLFTYPTPTLPEPGSFSFPSSFHLLVSLDLFFLHEFMGPLKSLSA